MKIPTTQILEAETKELIAETTDLTGLLDTFEITDQPKMDFAIECASHIKKQFKTLDEKRKSFTSPLKNVVKDIDQFFKPALDKLKHTEQVLKTKMSQYINSQTTIITSTKSADLSVRHVWACEVEDKEKIIRWCLEQKMLDAVFVDTASLLALTRIQNKDPEIPGLKVFKQTSLAVKAGA